MEVKEVALKIVKKNINIGGIAFDIIDEVLEEALKKVVADSSNKLDDMLMASIYPLLEKELKALISKKIGELMEEKKDVE